MNRSSLYIWTQKPILLARLAFSLLSLFCYVAPLKAYDEPRVPWSMDEKYSGEHQASYQKLSWQIPGLMRQTLINMSVRLGLDYQDGFRYPLVVRFVDDTPLGAENVLAYVQLYQTDKGIAQTLNVNLNAYDHQNFNFEKVLAHELVHALMNDAVGAQASLIMPTWLHEGLAVYGADQGDDMVKAYVAQTNGFEESMMLNGLEGPHGALDYGEDYLAIKYIAVEKGTNALHNFVRDLIARKGDYRAALKYTCFEDWQTFQTNAREFSSQELKNVGPIRRDAIEQPY